ncbi:Fanconi-associated nuclease [Mycena venus]|uniref:Fanconi-associated nuclease n=1 Tax=Mycena venus TaxID=2733690 RepID=A0A8H7CJQ8_9AGAR|nr:Fanconi-associated nuclease [Mycena venus]
MPKRLPTVKTNTIFTGFLGNGGRDELGETKSDLDLNSKGDYQDLTICLNLLKTMISTVLHTDAHLFPPAETNVLISVLGLSVDAQHLFTYLAIHPDKWHRLPFLKSAVILSGDLFRIIEELCCPISNKMKSGVKSDHPSDSFWGPSNAGSQSLPSNATVGPSPLFPFPRPQPNPCSLCISDAGTDLRQLLQCMDLKELNKIREQLKIKPKKNKADLIDSILNFSATQRTVTDFFKAKAKAEKPKSQQERLREMVMLVLQKLVRIDADVHNILLRVHIAYFRSTQLPTEVLPRPLRYLQRKYPKYALTRADGIWENWEIFIEYVDSLRAEATIDGVLPSGDTEATSQRSPEKTTGKRRREAVDDEIEVKDKKGKKAEAVRKAEATKELLDEVYPRWAAHNSIKTQSDPVGPGLERFEPGYALTRTVHKGMKALKILKERSSELDVFNMLLDQEHWCAGLRGSWHSRNTSILAEKMKDGAAGGAIRAARAAIKDTTTNLIYQESIFATLTKLQKRLQEDSVHIPEPTKVSAVVLEAMSTTEKKKACKWTRPDDDSHEMTIETLVSEHYLSDFQRVMPGNCFLTTLFTLLFWDILFMPMTGAFETAFQTCPLDLCEDTFFSSRRDAIELRLSEIKTGHAADFLQIHDKEHRASKVAAVGVRWDLCTRKDLTHWGW